MNGNYEDINILQTISNIGKEIGYAGAEKALKHAWEKTLKHTVGYIYAMYVRHDRKGDDAVNVFQLIARQTNDPRYWNQLGNNLYWRNKNEEAIKAYQEAIQHMQERDNEQNFYFDDYENKQTTLGIYHANLASVYVITNQGEEAIREAEIAIQNYDDPYSWESKIKALSMLGRDEETLSTTYKILADYKNSKENLADIYKTLLKVLQRLGRLEDYRKVYSEAVANYPEDFEFYRDMANYLIGKHLYSEAVDVYGEMGKANIDLSTKGFFAYDTYVLLHFIKQPEKAWEVIRPYAESFRWYEYEKSEKFRPDSKERYVNLITGLSSFVPEGDETGSGLLRNIVIQFLEHFPEDPELLAAFAYFLIKEKDYEKAKAKLSAGLSLVDNPIKSIFVNNLAYVQLLSGQVEEAYEILTAKSNTELLDQTIEMNGYIGEFAFRVAVWFNNNIEPDPTAKLFLDVPFKVATIANCVAIDLQRGDLDHATSLALRIISYIPLDEKRPIDRIQLQDCQYVGSLVMGSVALAKKEYLSAATAWRKALWLASTDILQTFNSGNILTSWLNEVETHLTAQELQDLIPKIS